MKERRREATRLREKRRERKEKERRGTGIAWHFVSFSVWSGAEKARQREEPKGRGVCPEVVCRLKKGEDAACKAKPGLEVGGLSGSLPSGYSPTTRCTAPLACLLPWLVQDSCPQLPLFFLSTPRCPFSLQFHPFQGPPTLCALYHHYPWSRG